MRQTVTLAIKPVSIIIARAFGLSLEVSILIMSGNPLDIPIYVFHHVLQNNFSHNSDLQPDFEKVKHIQHEYKSKKIEKIEIMKMRNRPHDILDFSN